MELRHEEIAAVFSREFLERQRAGTRVGRADLHRRPAALGLDADRADTREPQPGGGHARAADAGETRRVVGRYRATRGVSGGRARAARPGLSRLRTAVPRRDRAFARPSGRASRTSCPTTSRTSGFIHLILPNAKIINARRHPLDSILGGYKQLFAKGQHFTYDMYELALYYRQYHEPMRHWHRVLPGKVLDVHYEETVGDSRPRCGESWLTAACPSRKPACASTRTRAPVKTASSEQVRQPLYTRRARLLAALRKAPRAVAGGARRHHRGAAGDASATRASRDGPQSKGQTARPWMALRTSIVRLTESRRSFGARS